MSTDTEVLIARLEERVVALQEKLREYEALEIRLKSEIRIGHEELARRVWSIERIVNYGIGIMGILSLIARLLLGK